MNDFFNRLFHLQPSLLATMTHDAIRLVVAVVILVIGWWVSNRVAMLCARMLARSHADSTLVPMLAGVSAWAVRILTIVAALSEVGIATASVLAALGAAGLAIGLALQGTLQNIAAGIMLLLLRPFRAGDVIEGSGVAAGMVSELGLFTTRIERSDGNIVFVPNSQIWGNPVVNYSCTGMHRVDVTIDIARRDQVDAAMGKLKDLLAAEPRIETGSTLAATVTVDSYAANGAVRLRLRGWVRRADAPYAADDLRAHAAEALGAAGIQLASSNATATDTAREDTREAAEDAR